LLHPLLPSFHPSFLPSYLSNDNSILLLLLLLQVCKALRDHGVTAPIDVHLMVSPVDRIIGDFADAGASYITFHPEATNHIDRSLQLIKSRGLKAGREGGR